jgi:cephalosporin hydroxylase
MIEKIRKKNIKIQGSHLSQKKSLLIINELLKTKYNYQFDWLGIPAIQFPNDMMIIQELIFKKKPKIIIECGIGHGGMLIFYASILKLLNIKNFKVIGIDVLIKSKNRKRLKNHPLSKYIELHEISSINQNFFNKLKNNAKLKKSKKLIILDSNHTKAHVFKELNLYSTLLRKGEYIVVMDTIIEFIKATFNRGKAFKKGNSPYNAVTDFLKYNKNFKVDTFYENKSYLTVAKKGFLQKTK